MRSFYQLHIVPVPPFSTSIGEYAAIAFTDQFFYIHDGKKWRRTSFDQPPVANLPWAFPTKKLGNLATIDNQYFYLYFGGSWKSFGISSIDSRATNKNDAIYSPQLITDFNLQVIGARSAGEDTINASSYGREGSIAFDQSYLYFFIGGTWKKRGISDFSNVAPSPVGTIPSPVIPYYPPAPVIPITPVNLTVTSGSAILNWNSSSNDQEYFKVQRATNGINYSDFNISTTITYTDATVTSSISGATYWYQISAVNSVGMSDFSNTASITFTTATGSESPPTGIPDISGSVFSGSAPMGIPNISGSII